MDGLVGLGTPPAPGIRLDVNGRARIQSKDTPPRLDFYNAASTSQQIASIRHSSGSTRLGIFDDSNNERLAVVTEAGPSQGRVGVGTSSPGHLLHVEGAGTAHETLAKFHNQVDKDVRIMLGNAGTPSYLIQAGSSPDEWPGGMASHSLSLGINRDAPIHMWAVKILQSTFLDGTHCFPQPRTGFSFPYCFAILRQDGLADTGRQTHGRGQRQRGHRSLIVGSLSLFPSHVARLMPLLYQDPYARTLR